MAGGRGQRTKDSGHLKVKENKGGMLTGIFGILSSCRTYVPKSNIRKRKKKNSVGEKV